MQGTYQSLPRPIEDSDHINFRVALSTNHNVEFNRIIMQDAISYVARQNPYHPVRNFIEQQQWDHQQRAEQIFIKHQQADDTPLNRILTRKWLLAVVNRIYRPGCKFDHVLFLTGAEGTGKSSMWRALAIRDEWFTELETTEAKDVVEQTTGKMIVELSEGIVLDSRSKNQVKSMLSRQSPTVRMAYGHNAQEFPIQFCFAGCHNQHEFARDDDGSGLRRFWTIPIHRKANNPYDWTSFIADIPQIWAEVKTWYDQGELLEIPKEHMEALNAQRNLSIVQDDWEQDVINFLDGQISSRLDGKSEVKNRVCIKQIALEALSLDYGKMPRYDGNRIKNIMNKQTNWKHNGSKNMDMKQYGAQKGWYRLDTNNYEKGE